MRTFTEEIYTRGGRRIEFPDSMKVFNLGCGSQRYKNVIGIDVVKTSAADIIHDLDKTPWPIKPSTADVVLAFHTLEHVADLPRVMEEIHRISKPGAKVIVEVPYFRSILAYQDPTHRRFFTTRTFDYFSSETKLGSYRYAAADFNVTDFWLGWPAKSQNPLKQAFKGFIKQNHDFYDVHISRVFPVDILVFELEVKK